MYNTARTRALGEKVIVDVIKAPRLDCSRLTTTEAETRRGQKFSRCIKCG